MESLFMYIVEGSARKAFFAATSARNQKSRLEVRAEPEPEPVTSFSPYTPTPSISRLLQPLSSQHRLGQPLPLRRFSLASIKEVGHSDGRGRECKSSARHTR